MAASKAKKDDPVVSTESVKDESYPEGTHPPHPLEDLTYSVDRLVYKDNPDKPDPSSVAQVQVVED